MKVLDLFSGIGGFSLGLERAGMETVAFCEFDAHARQILEKHWPDVPIHEDVRLLDGTQYRGTVDVVCGGFPCQDISTAGKQEGIKEGTRSGLWSECARLLGEVRPKYAIFENVTGLLNGQRGDWFKRVLWDISKVGYDAEWHCISASELGAHHHRDRVWIIAYSASVFSYGRTNDAENSESQAPGSGSDRSENVLADSISSRQQRQGQLNKSLFAKAYEEGKTVNALAGSINRIWEIEPSVGRVADGIPDRMDRLTRLGNAVVPQIPEIIGRAIMELENES